MTIVDLLRKNAALYKDEVSLVEREPSIGSRRELSWREFESQSNKIANALINFGVKKTDKVVILLMNCLEWLPCYFGVLKTGAMAVPLNFRFTAEEIKKCISVSDGHILIYGPEFCERIESVRDELSAVKEFIYVEELSHPADKDCRLLKDNVLSEASKGYITYSEIMDYFPSSVPDIKLNIDEEAALYFTSGTTGTPKPIIITHKNLMASCIAEQKHHGQTREDKFLCIPPLYHTGAKMHWFGSLLSGSSAVLLKGVKPEWVLQAVSEEKATIVWLLVPWAQDILDAIENDEVTLEDYDTSQWRLMHIGAQPVPPSLITNWLKYFPNQQYDTNYGLSESTGPGCVHLGVENIHKVGAIGVPGFGWEIKIVDDKDMIINDDSVGELAVRGPGVMKGYYNNPEATEAILKDDWLYTGDMAMMDEDGFIYLVDRKKDVVISGGENIFPVEVENFLQAHAAIKDAAIIGMPDRRLGEIPLAIIELKKGRIVSEEDILEFCKGLPKYKRPRKIIFDNVPRNPTGKIEKPKLREKWCKDRKAVFV